MTLTVGAVCGLALTAPSYAFDPATLATSESAIAQTAVGSATTSLAGSQSTGDSRESNRITTVDVDSDETYRTLGIETVKAGSSAGAVRKLAVSGLPLDRLSTEGRAESELVLKNLGMYRRLPTLSFEVDPDVYAYFLKNPDVAVATWRAMDISKFELKEEQPNFYLADAGDGSVGHVKILYHTAEDTLIHCDGAFKSPLLPKPIVARSLMRLQSSFNKDAEGRIIGTHYGDVYVEFPSQAVEAVAKAISPLSHSIADRNFRQMTLFVNLMSQAMARHPGWIRSIGNKLDGVSPQRKAEFIEVSQRSHIAARRRLAGTAKPLIPFNPEDVIDPFRNMNTATTPNVPLTTDAGTTTLRN